MKTTKPNDAMPAPLSANDADRYGEVIGPQEFSKGLSAFTQNPLTRATDRAIHTPAPKPAKPRQGTPRIATR